MKHFAYIMLLLFSLQSVAQENIRDSLMQQLRTVENDTSRVWLLYELAGIYRFNRPDSGTYYGKKAWELARKINFPAGEVAAMRFMAISHITLGNDSKALQIDLEAIKLADQHGLLEDKLILLVHIGGIYLRSQDYQKALSYHRSSALLANSIGDEAWYAFNMSSIGENYMRMGQLDSAKYYSELAYSYRPNYEEDGSIIVPILMNLGELYQTEENHEMALLHFQESLQHSSNLRDESNSNAALGKFYNKINNYDSSLFYANKALEKAAQGNLYASIAQASALLADIIRNSDTEKALEYREMAMAYQDSLYKLGRAAALNNSIDFDEQIRDSERTAAEEEFQSQLRTNAFLGSSFTLIVIALLLYRNNRVQKKSKRKTEIAYELLQSTQSQLIHSEKMASLGELTAGIAHEIQNPLNFVNNFSDVNMELIVELNEAHAKGDKAEIEAITKDILENESKVAHHGKRAEAIVKSMLQHSRGSDGVKEPTDINALADEYLRLAYHGLRAKDQSFNAEFKTDFDENLPKVEVVPQDIGRVLLNLINNAFQAVKDVEKPEVKLETKKLKNSITISVADNGPGIPDDIKDKIFQPFFTTKPTGEGTGLGLSMSYDVVTKGHGGTLKVESERGVRTEFIIELPID